MVRSVSESVRNGPVELDCSTRHLSDRTVRIGLFQYGTPIRVLSESVGVRRSSNGVQSDSFGIFYDK